LETYHAAITFIVFYLLVLYLLALPNTPENPFASIYSESLIKTTCQHLMLLVGFDTLIYRKYYDTPPILVGHQTPPLLSPQSPLVDPLHHLEAMAVFELDPTPWLPWGHQVIDGGDTRLPRSYYNPMSDPPQQEHDTCIAIVEPAPLAIHEGHWWDRVRDFLVDTLNRQVLTYQPCIFGLGLYQLSSPNSREALVQHRPFHIEHNVFVRFINPNALFGCLLWD
jgi:hypothetical protein